MIVALPNRWAGPDDVGLIGLGREFESFFKGNGDLPYGSKR